MPLSSRRVPRIAAALLIALSIAGCETTTHSGANMLVAPSKVTRPAKDAAAIATTPAVAPSAVSMRWAHKSGSDAWTQATLAALDQYGVQMMSRVPADIDAYCPGYASRGDAGRRAFWAGFMSALSKHESTYNPQAKGGGGKWLGLMQIAPSTWRSYGCTGEMLNGADNMSCAVKIMSKQVSRDNAVARAGGSWRGVARDWAPLRSATKRADIAAWTSQQSYCQPRA